MKGNIKNIHESCAKALEKLDLVIAKSDQSSKIRRALVKGLEAKESIVRRSCAEALSKFGPMIARLVKSFCRRAH